MEQQLIAWLWPLTVWHWWALAAVLVALEVSMPTTLLVWPATAAALVGGVVLLAPGLDWTLQALLFAVLAVASTVVWQRRRRTPSDTSSLNRRSDALIGRRAALLDPALDGTGRVRLDDTVWRVQMVAGPPGAPARPAGGRFPAGTEVEVVGADGAVLKVLALPPPTAA